MAINKFDDPLEGIAEGLSHCIVLTVINGANSREEIERYAHSLKHWALAMPPQPQRVMHIVAGLVDEWLRKNPDQK